MKMKKVKEGTILTFDTFVFDIKQDPSNPDLPIKSISES